MVVRDWGAWTRPVESFGLAFRPLVVTLAIATAAAMWPPPAHADGLVDAGSSAVNGIGNNGPLSTTLAGIGQSLCPMLVKPGGTLASMATQMSGHTGLAPTIAGFVASTAIQMECPSWMTSLANGTMPAGLQALINTIAPSPSFQLPGAAPASPLPFALPGVSPEPSNRLQIPGL